MVELIYEVRQLDMNKFEPFAITLKCNGEIVYVFIVYENVFKSIFYSDEGYYLITTSIGVFFVKEITTMVLDRDCKSIYRRTTRND